MFFCLTSQPSELLRSIEGGWGGDVTENWDQAPCG